MGRTRSARHRITCLRVGIRKVKRLFHKKRKRVMKKTLKKVLSTVKDSWMESAKLMYQYSEYRRDL